MKKRTKWKKEQNEKKNKMNRTTANRWTITIKSQKNRKKTTNQPHNQLSN